LSVAHSAFGVASELDAGVRAHFEQQKRKQENSTNPNNRSGVVVEDSERETDAYSAFVQNRFLLGRFTISPGLRVERVKSERSNDLNGTTGGDSLTEVIPALGATFSLVSGTTFFAGVHKGFAPPRTEDVMIDGVGTSTEVDAEESWNYELGLRSQLSPRINVAATLFRNDFENLISVAQIAGGNTPLAEGEALFEGFELSGHAESETLETLGGRVFFDAAYTWLFTAESTTPFRQVANGAVIAGSEDGNRLPYAPEHLVTASIGFAHFSGWDARLEAVYVDDQFSDFANTQLSPANGNGQTGEIPDYTVFNAAFNYTLKPYGTTLFLTVKNIGDRDYIVDRTRGILPGIPRLMQAGFKYDY
jgi:Fe(3+) dicitrate transport protein